MDGRKFHPYSLKLTKLFEGDKREVQIISKGISGECVYQEMTTRLPKILKEDPPFNLIIILGGTNDLSHLSHAKSTDLFMQIKTLHEIGHSYGAQTCAVTIPQTAFDMLPTSGEYVNYREEVNSKIREFVADTSDKVCLCDMSVNLPLYGISNEEMQTNWDDELHLTPQGYNRMAEIIYESLNCFLSK